MTNLILPGKRQASGQTDYQRRMASAVRFRKASKDINLWKIRIVSKPDWAPPSCDHALYFYDRKTGIDKYYLIDQAQADEHGNYEAEHRRITEAFTRMLLELDELMKYIAACKLLGVRPDITQLGHGLEVKVRDELWRGDHDAGSSFE